VRTRMLGGVGAGGERPPATRFGNFLFLSFDQFDPVCSDEHLGSIKFLEGDKIG